MPRICSRTSLARLPKIDHSHFLVCSAVAVVITAEQCWRQCCCHDLKSKLAWARTNKVVPLDYVIAEARAKGLLEEGDSFVQVIKANCESCTKKSSCCKSKSSCCETEEVACCGKKSTCCEKKSVACCKTSEADKKILLSGASLTR